MGGVAGTPGGESGDTRDVGLRSAVSRRGFLERAGLVAALAGLAQVPGLLDAPSGAAASTPQVVEDTYRGLVAFIMPGSDAYSKTQGVSTHDAGGVASGGADALITGLDRYVPASAIPGGGTLPASGAVATSLNATALQVDPAASGPFQAPFANLSFAHKAAVLEQLEGESSNTGTELAFVYGILPGFAAFLCYSEAGVLNPTTRELTARPVGWKDSHYAGIAEGRKEFKGYWQGRRSVSGGRRACAARRASKHRARPRHRKRRRG